jgi:hypothetical protein
LITPPKPHEVVGFKLKRGINPDRLPGNKHPKGSTLLWFLQQCHKKSKIGYDKSNIRQEIMTCKVYIQAAFDHRM